MAGGETSLSPEPANGVLGRLVKGKASYQGQLSLISVCSAQLRKESKNFSVSLALQVQIPREKTFVNISSLDCDVLHLVWVTHWLLILSLPGTAIAFLLVSFGALGAWHGFLPVRAYKLPVLACAGGQPSGWVP